MLWWKKIGLLALLGIGGMPTLHGGETQPAERLPQPPYPLSARETNQQGLVVLRVRFTASGDVGECRVVRSGAGTTLAESTRSWVKANWHSQTLAGTVELLPVDYVLRGKWQWNQDFLVFPYCPFGADSLTLSVTFDSFGEVQLCSVTHSTGDPSFDSFAIRWAKQHWHHFAYAGKKVRLSFDSYRPSVGGAVIWRSG